MNAEQLNDLRQRVLRNEPVTAEELHAAINSIRGARLASNQAAAASAPKTSKVGGKLAGVDLASIIAGAMKKP